MGQNESQSRLPYMQSPDAFAYAPVLTSRTDIDFFPTAPPDHLEKPLFNQPAALLKTAYHGVWSMVYPESLCPETRIGQCAVLDTENNVLYIAYGSSKNGEELNDCWALDITHYAWRCVNSHCLGPRQYASAALIGRMMVVFGGIHERTFKADLHAINVDTGEIIQFSQNSFGPSPRVSPVLFANGNCLHVWSGFDGTSHSDLHTFNFSTSEWSKSPDTNAGRAAAAYCVFKGKYYIFGSSKGHGLLKFNPKKGRLKTVVCTGTEPPAELTHAQLVPADEFIFLIGGEADYGFMHLFALEVKRKWWFAFHVRPDHKTVTLSDGIVNKIGLFMMPREYSATACYSKMNRELISVMGSRMMDPPPIFKISIGEALGLMHIRSDMLELFDAQVRHGSN